MPTTGPSAWNIANYLTVFRLAIVPVFGWLLLADDGRSAVYRWAASRSSSSRWSPTGSTATCAAAAW